MQHTSLGTTGGTALCKVDWHEKQPGACSLPLSELPEFTILVDLGERALIDVGSVLCLHLP